MKTFGALILLAGLVWLGFAYSMDTSVSAYGYGRVQNLSLMETRNTHLLLSLGAVVVGVLLLGFGLMQRPAEAGKGYRTCPHCAESVRIEARLCKHCQRKLPAWQSDDPDYSAEADARGGSKDKQYSYRALNKAVEEAERKAKTDRSTG